MNSITAPSGFDIDAINDILKKNPEDLISYWENRYNSSIAEAAEKALSRHSRIIYLSGPSSSGKTTSSHILAEKLSAHGIYARTVSTDDFFKSRADAPFLPNGEPDLESIKAVDTDLLISTFNEVIADGRAALPKYDFQKGVRIDNVTEIDIGNDGILIMEGIHALNPAIVAGLSPHSYIKIYVSIHSSFERRGEIVLPKRWARFIQRMVRDHRTRGIPPEENMRLWQAVFEGEDKYIRPYASTAHFRIDTTPPYSPAVLKDNALLLLSEIPQNSPHYSFAAGLSNAIGIFASLNGEYIPKASVLREFIGGGIYE